MHGSFKSRWSGALLVCALALGLLAPATPAVAQAASVVAEHCNRWGPAANWVDRRNTSYGHNRDYAFTWSEGDGRSPVNGCEWVTSLPGGGGRFRVDVFVPHAESVALTRYFVRHNGGQTPILVNQRSVYGWHTLGTFDINGPQASVGVNDATGRRGETIGIDAVRWTRVSQTNPGAGSREEAAIAWAEARRGSTAYEGYCEQFTSDAYRVSSGRYGSANAHWNDMVRRGLARYDANPPRGALVFWEGYGANASYGHTGISLGNGRFIATSVNGRVDVATLPHYRGYRGWSPPVFAGG